MKGMNFSEIDVRMECTFFLQPDTVFLSELPNHLMLDIEQSSMGAQVRCDMGIFTRPELLKTETRRDSEAEGWLLQDGVWTDKIEPFWHRVRELAFKEAREGVKPLLPPGWKITSIKLGVTSEHIPVRGMNSYVCDRDELKKVKI